MQSCSQIITTNKPTPVFLQAGCPSCRPTNSVKARKGKYHIPWTCPKLTWGLPTLSLTTNSSWLPWGRVRFAMPLISPLKPVPHLGDYNVFSYIQIWKCKLTHCIVVKCTNYIFISDGHRGYYNLRLFSTLLALLFCILSTDRKL